MQIRQKQSGEVVVLSLKGNLVSVPDAEELRGLVYRLLEGNRKKVVFDMAGVPAINSSGLGALVAALTSLRRRGGDLRLTRLSKKVEGTMAITHLINVFQIYDHPRRAVASFME